jgi:hypothetical protein
MLHFRIAHMADTQMDELKSFTRYEIEEILGL